MARREQISGGETETLAAATKTALGGNLATRGADYVRFALVNVGPNPIEAAEVTRSVGGVSVLDDAMNTAILAKLPLAVNGYLDIEYTRPVGDSMDVSVTSAAGTDVQWGFYVDNQGGQSGPVPS